MPRSRILRINLSTHRLARVHPGRRFVKQEQLGWSPWRAISSLRLVAVRRVLADCCAALRPNRTRAARGPPFGFRFWLVLADERSQSRMPGNGSRHADEDISAPSSTEEPDVLERERSALCGNIRCASKAAWATTVPAAPMKNPASNPPIPDTGRSRLRRPRARAPHTNVRCDRLLLRSSSFCRSSIVSRFGRRVPFCSAVMCSTMRSIWPIRCHGSHASRVYSRSPRTTPPVRPRQPDACGPGDDLPCEQRTRLPWNSTRLRSARNAGHAVKTVVLPAPFGADDGEAPLRRQDHRSPR